MFCLALPIPSPFKGEARWGYEAPFKTWLSKPPFINASNGRINLLGKEGKYKAMTIILVFNVVILQDSGFFCNTILFRDFLVAKSRTKTREPREKINLSLNSKSRPMRALKNIVPILRGSEPKFSQANSVRKFWLRRSVKFGHDFSLARAFFFWLRFSFY